MDRKEFLERLTARFVERMRTQEIKPRTMQYKRKQLEFFVGAESALVALSGSGSPPFSITEMLVFVIAPGRDMAVEFPGHTQYLTPAREGTPS